ncbi:Basic-leucine zipper transcription factor family protein, putative [Theobroma cacao]|uniref:Basic-leucine zipper transcription factor family protein, putative n=1 Tax=Theobroma cacao TaxID=3641 RepID=A0A061H0C8_THECC|nr:Basic-leucine zipper transcription factor family protein, putative [Theobroma cacao]
MEGIKIENVEQTPDAPLPMLPSSGSGKADHEMAPADQIDQSKTGKHVPDQVRQGEGRGLGNNMDPKKLKRITAGREYSLRYRLKQQQHTAQMETDVRSLQAGLALYSSRIKYADTHNSLLRAENSCMQQKLTALGRQLAFKNAEYQQLKLVREELKEMSLLYHVPYPPIFSQTENYGYQLVNRALNQPGFNQSMEPAGAPDMQNQNWENQFGFGHPNNEGINRGPM